MSDDIPHSCRNQACLPRKIIRELFEYLQFSHSLFHTINSHHAPARGEGGGGGGVLRYKGGPHLSYVFRGRRGLFLRPPHVRDFVKEGYFFVPRYEVWGSKSPYNPQNIRGSDAE